MRKLIKLFLALIVIIIIAAVALPFLLPLETYKQEISARVKNATGRDLAITGHMSARLFPNIALTAEGVSLSNPEGYSAKNMLSVDKLAVEVELAPLFSKQIKVKRFVLDKPVINLEKNAAGKPNWEFSSAAAAPQAAPEPAPKTSSAAALAGFTLGDVTIKNGALTYRDAKTKTAQSLTDINLNTAFSGLAAPLDAKGSAVWNGETLTLEAGVSNPSALASGQASAFAIALGGAPITLSYKGNAAMTGASGNADITIPSLPKLVKWTGGAFDWKGATALSFTAKGALNCDLTACSFSKSQLSLDAIKAKGDFWFGFSGKPEIVAKLAIDALDLNPYLAKKHASLSLISSAYAMEPWSSEKIDLSGLRAANANVHLTLGSLLYDKIKVGKSSLALSLQNGALKTSMPNAEFYGGSISSSGTMDASGAFSKSVTIAGVKAEPFLKDAMNDDRFSGTMSMAMNISGSLPSVRGMVESLGGSGNIKLTDGAIKGVDLAGMIRNVQSAFKNTDTKQQKTDFSELGGTFSIARGVITNNDLAMKAPLLRLAGKGTVDLPRQQINYRLTPEIVATKQGQGGKEKQGLEVPVIVSGPLDNPSYAPDLASMVNKALENPEAIKETVKDVKQQLKENKGALKDLLKGLKGK